MEPDQIMFPATRAELTRIMCEKFAGEIGALPFTPKLRDAINDGFADGLRVGITETLKFVAAMYELAPKADAP